MMPQGRFWHHDGAMLESGTGTVSDPSRSAAIEVGKLVEGRTPNAPVVHEISRFISGLGVHPVGMRRRESAESRRFCGMRRGCA